MAEIIIYHHPGCRKNGAGLTYLQGKGEDNTIRPCRKESFTKEALPDDLKKPGIPASGMIRTQEA
ncbi:MAG: hypothetical protein J7K46_01065 [Bacteroidales bacterium]|nr:hypothetical protein [Bacteroidales bacterium]